jgi:hypothetical protein
MTDNSKPTGAAIETIEKLPKSHRFAIGDRTPACCRVGT